MRIGMRTIKTVISATLAMLIAGGLSLLYWPSSGIIAVLSVGNTRRSTIMTGVDRFIAFILATVVAFLSFKLLGFSPIGFGLFLFLFIPLAVQFKLTEGIVVNSVLVTQYLVEQSMEVSLILNALGLMVIGVGLALIANIYMPNTERRLQENQLVIEVEFRQLLQEMADSLLKEENERHIEEDCQQLLTFIRTSQLEARNHHENDWIRQEGYYETYFSMRRAQLNVLNNMIQNLERIEAPNPYSEQIYGLLIYTAETFAEENDGTRIMERIHEVYAEYRQMPLPQKRSEFENRAEMFQFLQSFKSFIEIKAEFAQQKQQINS